MNLIDLTRAHDALLRLQKAERDADAIKDFRVVGISVSRLQREGADAIALGTGRGGTGSINGISWSDDLSQALTRALADVFELRANAARTELQALGVDAQAAS